MVNREQGFSLIGVLLVLAFGLLSAAAIVELSATNAKTRALVKTQANYYYQTEETLNRTVAWLQENSKSIVTAFTAANFDGNFDLGSPSLGSNEGVHFQTPTMVKMNGTDNAVMLSNNSFFGEAAFPSTTNSETGAAFNAVSAFASADLGQANARAVVIWARETNGNYAPIFRVDAITGNDPDRGAHTYTYVYTQIIEEPGVAGGGEPNGAGFFTNGGNFSTQTGNNQCYSYEWSFDGTTWSKGAPQSNCVIESRANITLESRINGNVYANQTVTVDPPSGEVSGNICEGAGCTSMTLAPFDDWSTTCSADSQGNLTINGNVTLASGAALSQQCWETVEIRSNGNLTLTGIENPYRFKTLKFQNSSNSVLTLPVLGVDERVTVYVDNWVPNALNGNMLYNTNNAPRSWEINITSTSSFTLNGTADMHAYFIAPEADVYMLGNFNYHGAIHADQIDISGNARFNYDEGILGGGLVPIIYDMAFTIRKAGQRYR